MNPQLLAALINFEPELRKLLGDNQSISVSISLDATGANYSFNASSPNGNNQSFSQRISTSKTA
jgi:hypothetical protein